MNVTFRLRDCQSGDSQGQETFLAPYSDKEIYNYEIECSNHHSSLSTRRPKGLSRRKMKWWAIYTHLLVNVIVWLLHPWSGYSQVTETFLAPSACKQTCNYDIECLNHHLFLSTLKLKGLSCSKMKWWARYTNFLVNGIVRLDHPRDGDSQSQEMFLAASADKETHNYDIDCSNNRHSLWSRTSKGLSCSKMKWWAIYADLPVNAIARLPHPGSGERQHQETFSAPSADK